VLHCGISAAMRGRLRRQVNYVIHCAASIIFNEHVHTLLANNYEVTINYLFGTAFTSPVQVAAASFHDGGHFLGQQPAFTLGQNAQTHCTCNCTSA
jgi:hypothetical protein